MSKQTKYNLARLAITLTFVFVFATKIRIWEWQYWALILLFLAEGALAYSEGLWHQHMIAEDIWKKLSIAIEKAADTTKTLARENMEEYERKSHNRKKTAMRVN